MSHRYQYYSPNEHQGSYNCFRQQSLVCNMARHCHRQPMFQKSMFDFIQLQPDQYKYVSGKYRVCFNGEYYAEFTIK